MNYRALVFPRATVILLGFFIGLAFLQSKVFISLPEFGIFSQLVWYLRFSLVVAIPVILFFLTTASLSEIRDVQRLELNNIPKYRALRILMRKYTLGCGSVFGASVLAYFLVQTYVPTGETQWWLATVTGVTAAVTTVGLVYCGSIWLSVVWIRNS